MIPKVGDTEKVIEEKWRGRVQTDKNQESYFLKVYKTASTSNIVLGPL